MSFEVTVTPTVYNVEVEVNPSVQPFDVVVEVGNVPDLDLTTNGDSGASTFDPLTGDLNIPEYTLDGLGGVPESRTITINGTTQDLSADRTFTIPAPDPVTIGSPANGLSVTSGQVLSIGLASGSTNGALSSTDWTTFNGKQNALGFTAENVANKAINLVSPDDTKYPTTLAVSTALAGKQNTLTNPITGTGTSGQVAFFNGTTTQTGDNGLFWDNVNGRLGIGNNAPSYSFDVNTGVNLVARFVGNYVAYQNTVGALGTGNSIEFATNSNTPRIDFVVGGVYTGAFSASGNNLDLQNNSGIGTISLRIGATGARFRLFGSTGNVLIQNGGTFTDAGFRLDVNGTARVQGALTVSTGGASITGNVSSTGLISSALGFNGTQNDLSIYNTTNDTGFIRFLTQTGGVATERMRIFPNGNIVIDRNTDAGFRFDVAGTARIVGRLTVGSLLPTSTASGGEYVACNFQNNATANNTSVSIKFDTTTSVNGASGSKIQSLRTNTGSSGAADLIFYTSINTSTLTEVLRIKSSLNVLIGTTTDVDSSILTLESTTKGFLPPRLTSAQRDAIASPAAGLVVYNTTDNLLSFYNGTAWTNL
jgi:hypothetical protein